MEAANNSIGWFTSLWRRYWRRLTWKRVFFSFNPTYISTAQVVRIPWQVLRINAIILKVEQYQPYLIWDIDRLKRGQFEQLKTLVEKAIADTEAAAKEQVES